MKQKLASNSFIVFSVVYLLIILIGKEDITWYLKPFLLPFLLFWVYTFDPFPTKKILLFALVFSWIGDVILMFANINPIYFTLGLVAFLISHCAYIMLFSKQLKLNKIKSNFVFYIGIGTILIYLTALVSLILPNLGELKIPVILYATVLSTMLFFSFKGSLQWQNPGNIYILLGAIIFVSSDSILAINKFYTATPYASFWIMLTYLTAQFLIVNGILRLNKKNSII